MAFNPFAHLMGLKFKGSRAEDEDEKARGRAEDDDENAEDDDEPKSRKAKGRRAEDDDDDERAEDDDEDAEDDDEPKSRKAKGRKAEGDDDEADAKAQGRAIERKRCARIFGSKAAGIRPDMAASLAFNTDLSASAAIAQLEQAAAFGAPQGGRMSLDERMRGEQRHRLGPDAKQTQSSGPSARIDRMKELYNQSMGTK